MWNSMYVSWLLVRLRTFQHLLSHWFGCLITWHLNQLQKKWRTLETWGFFLIYKSDRKETSSCTVSNVLFTGWNWHQFQIWSDMVLCPVPEAQASWKEKQNKGSGRKIIPQFLGLYVGPHAKSYVNVLTFGLAPLLPYWHYKRKEVFALTVSKYILGWKMTHCSKIFEQ